MVEVALTIMYVENTVSYVSLPRLSNAIIRLSRLTRALLKMKRSAFRIKRSDLTKPLKDRWKQMYEQNYVDKRAFVYPFC